MIFVKYPTRGTVKTRLAKTIGNADATLLYKEFVDTIINRTESKDVTRVVFYTPYNKRYDIMQWLGKDFIFYPQRGKDLGKRLRNAFALVFNKGAKNAIVIGTDSPLIDQDLIRKALDKLKQCHCVIGPSRDGGYYLLGLSCFCEEIFKGIQWSSASVFEQTLNCIKRAGLAVDILPAGFDVDTKEDLLFLKEELQRRTPAGPQHLDRLREIIDNVFVDVGSK